MRVESKKSFILLKSLGLDQPYFGLSKRLILREKLEALHQDLRFLERCEKNGLIPDCARRSINPPVSIRHSRHLQRTLDRTRHSMLTHLIRSKYRCISTTKEQIATLQPTLPATIINRLQEPLRIAKRVMKMSKKKTLKRKYEQLQKARQQNSTARQLQVTQQPKQRVSVLADIDVSREAINALAKGPNFALSKLIPREELQHTVQVEIAALAYSMRWHATMDNPSDTTKRLSALSLNQLCPFRNKQSEPPQKHKNTERAIQGLQIDLQRLVEKHNHNIKYNMSRKRRKLSARYDHPTISPSQKVTKVEKWLS